MNLPCVCFSESLKDVVLGQEVLVDDLSLGIMLLELNLEHLIQLLVLVQNLISFPEKN